MAEPTEQPGVVLIAISAVALAVIGGAFYVSYVAATEPPQPPGVQSTAPAASQPATDETGEPLPPPPDSPDATQPANTPPEGSTAQAPAQQPATH